MDLEIEKIYSFRAGVAKGQQGKAIEDAVVAVKDFHATPQAAAEKMNAPLEKVLEALENN